MLTGRVYNVETGKLSEVQSLYLRGIQWNWTAISSVLQYASDVTHLTMKVEFCGNSETLLPFPEVDLVNFFNSHPKLLKFEIYGAMFASFCQKNSLAKVSLFSFLQVWVVLFVNCFNLQQLKMFYIVLVNNFICEIKVMICWDYLCKLSWFWIGTGKKKSWCSF